MGIICIQVQGNVPPVGNLISGRNFCTGRVCVICILVRIDQYLFSNGIQPAVLKPGDQVLGVFIIPGDQYGIAVREGLDIR